MDEERMTILRMVAENKITAAEAAQLLDALKEGQSGYTSTATDQRSNRGTADDDFNYSYTYDPKASREEKRREREQRRRERHAHRERHREARKGHQEQQVHDFSSMMENVFGEGGLFGKQGIFAGFGTCGDRKRAYDLTIKEGTEAHITCTAGNLTVRGADDEQLRIRVEGQGFMPRFISPRVHHDPETNRVDIIATSQNLIIEAPWQMTSLHTVVTGGNARISDLSADLNITQSGGNLTAESVAGKIEARVSGGQAEMNGIHSSEVDIRITGGALVLSMGVITDGGVALKTVGGNATLRLPATSAFEIDARAVHGEIQTNLDAEVEYEGTDRATRSLHALHNGGGAMISLVSKGGNIDVEVTDSAATERFDHKE